MHYKIKKIKKIVGARIYIKFKKIGPLRGQTKWNYNDTKNHYSIIQTNWFAVNNSLNQGTLYIPCKKIWNYNGRSPPLEKEWREKKQKNCLENQLTNESWTEPHNFINTRPRKRSNAALKQLKVYMLFN